jgi:hypothetical protein
MNVWLPIVANEIALPCCPMALQAAGPTDAEWQRRGNRTGATCFDHAVHVMEPLLIVTCPPVVIAIVTVSVVHRRGSSTSRLHW